MSNDNNSKKNSGDVGALGSEKCRFESCKSKNSKFGFCQEHFEMYMAGVIRGDGVKPLDFEKKFEQFKAIKKVA